MLRLITDLIEEKKRARAQKSPEELTEEERREERRAANRLSAFQSRQRRKKIIEDLKLTVSQLSRDNENHQRTIADLKRRLGESQKENELLRSLHRSSAATQPDFQPQVAPAPPAPPPQQEQPPPQQPNSSNPAMAALLSMLLTAQYRANPSTQNGQQPNQVLSQLGQLLASQGGSGNCQNNSGPLQALLAGLASMQQNAQTPPPPPAKVESSHAPVGQMQHMMCPINPAPTSNPAPSQGSAPPTLQQLQQSLQFLQSYQRGHRTGPPPFS